MVKKRLQITWVGRFQCLKSFELLVTSSLPSISHSCTLSELTVENSRPVYFAGTLGYFFFPESMRWWQNKLHKQQNWEHSVLENQLLLRLQQTAGVAGDSRYPVVTGHAKRDFFSHWNHWICGILSHTPSGCLIRGPICDKLWIKGCRHKLLPHPTFFLF